MCMPSKWLPFDKLFGMVNEKPNHLDIRIDDVNEIWRRI